MKHLISLFLFLLFIPGAFAQKSCNCCAEAYKAFDFWVGTWDVTKPDGSPAGKNTIDKIQDSCILRENWVSAAGGYTGTSYNFYNARTQQWEQLWIDNQGGSLHLKGKRTANRMVLQSEEQKNKKGEPFYHRITWTLNADGSVRQLWETITNGKDIAVAFDGLYKKAQ